MYNKPIDRRTALAAGAATILGGAGVLCRTPISTGPTHAIQFGFSANSTHAIIPIIGDGRWIWRDPPAEKGQLEPRDYEIRIGITATGRISARNFESTTAAPVEHPEQQILDARIEQDGCQAELKTLAEGAGQLVVRAPFIGDNQTIRGEAIFKIRLTKTYLGYERDQFPLKQDVARDIAQKHLSDSPGIETRLPKLREIVNEMSAKSRHPWDLAKAFHEWVHTKIEGVPMPYTSVKRALQTLRGDCEERAGVFVALCRNAGIPARLVWLPNHAWAEFLLHDESGQSHWIPAHTAGYSWFGWTGAHELILQKGDRIRHPESNKNLRLVHDWWRYQGTRPKLQFTASIKPLPAEPDADPGPGDREKQPTGQWLLTGSHRDQRYMRQ